MDLCHAYNFQKDRLKNLSQASQTLRPSNDKHLLDETGSKIRFLLPGQVMLHKVELTSVSSYQNTVKPLYSGHHRDQEKVSAIRRCPPHRGSTVSSKEVTLDPEVARIPPQNSEQKRM